tara:strand:+ start:2002 stop:2262 length:261 start_codon:yes stop_codon:yes gene_type:complete
LENKINIMEFKIDKNTPYRDDKYKEFGLDEMNFGDNKLFLCKPSERKNLSEKIRRGLTTYKLQTLPKKTSWAIRKDDKGIRLWRLG